MRATGTPVPDGSAVSRLACARLCRTGIDGGTPLTIDTSSLVDRTYHFDTPAADFVKPVGLGSLLGAFLEAPLLIGVTAAVAETLDLLGAMGWSVGGRIERDTDQPTWDIPPGSFADAPFFKAGADRVTFYYAFGSDRVTVPLDEFEVEGTFALRPVRKDRLEL